jgi:hypothetical protein
MIKRVWLDYAGVAKQKLLQNLSAVASVGEFMWTASDEGRTIECLERAGDHYRLRGQFVLDDHFPDLPGAGSGDEIDIESLDAINGRLWICGSHCRVRSKSEERGTLNPEIRDRTSRCFLGAVELQDDGATLSKRGQTLPFAGSGALRRFLERSRYLEPFLALPSKENGLDIEGIVVRGTRIFFGLRGPVVDGVAIAAEIEVEDGLKIASGEPIVHLLDLGGLGIRDLARIGDRVAILAGPVGSVAEPFRIHFWTPRRTPRIQLAPETILFDWLREEHPEGLCVVPHKRKPGFLVLYDAQADMRIRDTSYRADWIATPKR